MVELQRHVDRVIELIRFGSVNVERENKMIEEDYPAKETLKPRIACSYTMVYVT